MNRSDESRAWQSQLELGLVPTFACNLRCTHCFVGRRRRGPSMGLEQFLTALRDAKALGVRSLQITGGELFVYSHRLAVLQHLVGTGIPTGISTNGTRLSRDDVAVLQGSRVSLCLSIDGPSTVHDAMRGAGAFAKTARAAAHCVRYDVPFDVSSTVTRSSLPHVLDTVRQAIDMGARSVHLSPLQRLGGRSEDIADQRLGEEDCVDLMARLAAVRDSLPDGVEVSTRNLGLRVTAVTHPCAVCACWGEFCPSKKYWPTSLYLTPDGEVLPQSMHVHPRYSLGNAFEEGLTELIGSYWQSAKHRRFQALCRYVYQDLIYDSDRPLFYWDELLRQASHIDPDELPAYETVSHPHDHSEEIAEARRAGLLDAAPSSVELG